MVPPHNIYFLLRQDCSSHSTHTCTSTIKLYVLIYARIHTYLLYELLVCATYFPSARLQYVCNWWLCLNMNIIHQMLHGLWSVRIFHTNATFLIYRRGSTLIYYARRLVSGLFQVISKCKTMGGMPYGVFTKLYDAMVGRSAATAQLSGAQAHTPVLMLYNTGRLGPTSAWENTHQMRLLTERLDGSHRT
jgi:hypothetical protein